MTHHLSVASSVTNDPVLHFLLFVPSASSRPLRILDADGSFSTSDAFLLPQWGGIVIYNPPSDLTPGPLDNEGLRKVFRAFSSQLQILLGVPPIPPYVRVTLEEGEIFNAWQMDTLLRQRTLENVRAAKDTLSSTVKLVDEIDNMPVDRIAKGDIQQSVEILEQVNNDHSHRIGGIVLTQPIDSIHASKEERKCLASRSYFPISIRINAVFKGILPPRHACSAILPKRT
jgi:GPI-anchor transamidase subunit S